MLALFRAVIGFLTSVSVVVSFVTYYLSWNKTWQHKHEAPVAASISVASSVIYLAVTGVQLLNLLLTNAPWQTTFEYVMAEVGAVFLLVVGAGWWVPHKRQQGLGQLLLSSLRSERQQLGVLARALAYPTGSRKIIAILASLALLDDSLDARELALIQLFADAWGVRVDWRAIKKASLGSAAVRYERLHRLTEDYLALTPPPRQAIQLVDLIRKLANADTEVSGPEAAIIVELTGLLETYAGHFGKIMYEIHLVPQSSAQLDAIKTSMPGLEERSLPGGLILIAGRYFALEYAHVVQDRYQQLGCYSAVVQVRQTEA